MHYLVTQRFNTSAPLKTFLVNFDSNSVCSFHFVCPCSRCHALR